VLLKAQYRKLKVYQKIKTVFTIHNLQYQGIFPISNVEDYFGLGDWAYTSDKLEFFGMCSFMKGGIVYADEITTVSPTYALEIQTAYYGERLDGLLRARIDSLTGILNGIDTEEYDPATNPYIAHKYDANTYENKLENKLALQRELGLTIDPNIHGAVIVNDHFTEMTHYAITKPRSVRTFSPVSIGLVAAVR